MRNEMKQDTHLIPIYTTQGDAEAFLAYPYIYNRTGEWIGWVKPDREVYSVHGHYVGWLSDDPRILRKRSSGYLKPRLTPPPAPTVKVRPPAHVPLPPMMAEIAIGTFDVLDESPELMPSVDYGDLRDDMD
jgi:hypothetical protein